MSRNIKEIGKELMGKSLNSFHRKTGLTQLEKNNEMQDGILNGILSQVDDAYIEKTEQSNVIHLDGSGDGVVVLDSIEGNTMVNLSYGAFERHGSCTATSTLTETSMTSTVTREGSFVGIKKALLKDNTTYTVICDLNTNLQAIRYSFKNSSSYTQGTSPDDVSVYINGYTRIKKTITTTTDCTHVVIGYHGTAGVDSYLNIKNMVVLEGDWTNRELPPYFEGLQSSFEEKVTEQGKYEIEILSQNENIFNIDSANTNHIVQNNGNLSSNSAWVLYDYEPIAPLQNIVVSEKYVNGRYFQYRMCYYDKDKKFISAKDLTGYDGYKIDITPMGAKYFRLNHSIAVNGNSVTREEIMVSYGTTYRKEYIPYKQNKIKLLINEPLRAVGSIKDRLCIKDGKLVVERNCGIRTYQESDLDLTNVLTDMNNTVYILDTPIYDEVTNEYGEPIILEGYENGTLYIDSTIVPTTTVKYTPKMESFNTLKEVYNNNVMLTSDVNDNIIPYMMEVDLMIMEKEMALPSQINIRKMEVLDMTSMQKRTQDMLERLIKGKSLTEQECKTRITTYLNAGKITDEQAEELMLLIDEVYA